MVQLWDFKSIPPSFLPHGDTVSRVGDLHAEVAESHFLFCSLTKNAISKMLTPKTLTNADENEVSASVNPCAVFCKGSLQVLPHSPQADS